MSEWQVTIARYDIGDERIRNGMSAKRSDLFQHNFIVNYNYSRWYSDVRTETDEVTHIFFPSLM